MRRFLLLLSIIVGTATSTSAQYVDPDFSIKDLKVFIQIVDKAKEGCWTNISYTRKYGLKFSNRPRTTKDINKNLTLTE